MTRFIYNDASHRYWYDGKPVSGATGIASIGIDRFGVDIWRKRRLAIGLAQRPDLAELIASHYDDDKKVDEYAEMAMAAAAGHDKANLGTAVHRHLERVDLHEDIIETPLSQALKVAWWLALERAGLEIVPEYVERFVIWPDPGVCGRFDRLVRRTSDGQLCILDIKNGATIAKYPHAVAVQLDIYARAPLMAGEMHPHGENGSIATEEFIDMTALDIDQEVGYVVRTSGVADGECAEVLEVDIAAGHRALTKVVFPALKWRKVVAEGLMRPIASAPIAQPEPATDDDFDRANGEAPCPVTPTSPSPTTMTAPSTTTQADLSTMASPTASTKTAPSTTRRSQILARLTALPDAQKVRIKAHWPNGTPSLKSTHEHTDAELDAIEAVMAEHTKTVMDVATMSEPPRIAAEELARTYGMPDEGPLVSDEDVDALRKAFSELDTAGQLWLSIITQQCSRSGYSLSNDLNPHTKRRWAIGTALVHLARLGVGTDDTHEATVRALLGVVMGEEVRPIIVTGTAIAALTIDEAERLAVLAQAVGAEAVVYFDEGGGLTSIEGPAVEAARRVA